MTAPDSPAADSPSPDAPELGGRVRSAWMDQGGTFTDVVRIDEDGRWQVEKVLSVGARLEELARGASDVRRGTTVATNALLERALVPVVLLTTEGFADACDYGDQVRPELFAQTVRRTAPLSPTVYEISGRLDATGTPVSGDPSPEVGPDVPIQDASVAVVLVHGPRSPEVLAHVCEQARSRGARTVTSGVEVAPTAGFVERLRTTVVDAGLTPLLPRARGRWMCSDGGLADHDSPEWRGVRAVLSGPAGGVVSVAAHAFADTRQRAFVGLDMGGTSTDVCRVGPGGAVQTTQRVCVDGLRLATPAVRIDTIAAGGGSRLGMHGGVLTVGPHSAGSDPGPACYGRGGPLCLTDAEAVLGRLPVFPAVAGPRRTAPLDIAHATACFDALDPGESGLVHAAGYRRVAHSAMAQAVRRLAAEAACDPADHVLVAFGGAGPAHACGVARELGIREVHVPVLAGVWSAVGIGMARARAERQRMVRESLAVDRTQVLAELPFDGEVEVELVARHVGTAGGLHLALSATDAIQADRDATAQTLPSGVVVIQLGGALREAFDARHKAVYGFVRPEQAVEAVAVRAVVHGPRASVAAVSVAPPACAVASTQVWFEGEWQEVPVVAVGTDASTQRLQYGPMVVVLPGSTLFVEDGWSVRHAGDHLVLHDQAAGPPPLGLARHPVHTAVFGDRLAGIAAAMGETLARLARSVSIRDRRDFSCAVFDENGRLAVNAPHVPVHLGAMGETVRALQRGHGLQLRPGEAWVTNDPYNGGSHLPDITVTRGVFADCGRLVGFVACRGHHVDVGGSRPGSMPPDARHIAEEGVIIPHHRLVTADGAFVAPHLGDCRQTSVVLADLRAQVAACAQGAAALADLLGAVGVDVVQAQLGHLQHVAADAAWEAVKGLEGPCTATEVFDDGTPLTVTIRPGTDAVWVDVAGPAHPGNLNAPTAVARAAVLYALRCLVGRPIPLNEGVLDRVRVRVQPDGLFDPRPPRAVAGGNVETSQRLVDALFRALGMGAAGQGTMNNLTIGTVAGAWYETLGGGAGGTATGPGASAVQVHMTNTRATDVELLEQRFPVRLERLARRWGSGGAGTSCGGDGLVKQWRFLARAEVALLAGRRRRGAPGLAGGEAGSPGRDLRDIGDGWEPAPAVWEAAPGDRLRIETPGGGGYGRPPSTPPAPGDSLARPPVSSLLGADRPLSPPFPHHRDLESE